MMTRRLLTLGTATLLMGMKVQAAEQQRQGHFIRWAELEVDPGKMSEFQAVAHENAAASLQEPGVMAFHWAAEKGKPHQIRVLEIYRNLDAYRAHLQSPHFQRFAEIAKHALRSRRVVDATPLALGAKPQLFSTTAHVRVAELEIMPAQLAGYQAAVTEEIEDSIRLEPGVLAIYSMSIQDRPNQLRFFEIYADHAAYLQHIASPHFKKYVETTQSMISSRKLFEMESPSLAAKTQ